MIKIKHFKKKKTDKTIIILIVTLISLYSIISPLQTFCATDKIYSLSEDLNGTVVEELQEIDFSAFNDVIDEFNERYINTKIEKMNHLINR